MLFRSLSQDVTKTDPDRVLYDKEFQQLGSYIKDIAGKDFNGVSLFTSVAKDVTIDSDATKWSMAGIDIGGSTTAYSAATGSTVNISTSTAAATTLGLVKSAITQLTIDRATVGSTITRLNFTGEQLGVQKTNLSASNSRIRDVDVAEESTQYARYNILVQAGTAMLAQANSQPQSVLRLLG